MAGAVPLAAAAPAALAAVTMVRSSPYDTLRVHRTATQAEIKAAYRTMAKRLHPDASSSAAGGRSGAAAFMEIRWAYETLSDPAERARCDLSLGGGTMRVRRWETDQCW